MAISYKKLWHILLDKNMKKKEFAEKADLTAYAIKKLNRNENVTTEVIGKICKALDCTPDDIMEFIDEEQS
jgi:putative transcriptional regulator